MIELECAETPADADWDAAIEFGIDVTLLTRNLSLSPCERLRQAQQHLRYIESVHHRTLPREVQLQREHERLWEKIEALGGPDPAWPEALRNGC